jgi:hypothetical protein
MVTASGGYTMRWGVVLALVLLFVSAHLLGPVLLGPYLIPAWVEAL